MPEHRINVLEDALDRRIEALKSEPRCKRKPGGRICKILKEEPSRLKIEDNGFWTGWVSRKTIDRDWHRF